MTNYNAIRMADSLRQMSFEWKTMSRTKQKTHTDDLPEHRYEESVGEYKLRTWNNGRETTEAGLLHMRPEWLSTIINVARIGDHAKLVNEPPPEIIVWFRTNQDGTLHSFVDFMNP